MPYCTAQDMIDRFGEPELLQLTDRAGVGVIDDQALGLAINDASAQIDGYLAGRYELPLATVPTILVSLACDLARYQLYDIRATDSVEKRRDDAIAYLKDVATGKVSLGLSSGGVAATPSDGAQMQSGGRIFGRDTGGFL